MCGEYQAILFCGYEQVINICVILTPSRSNSGVKFRASNTHVRFLTKVSKYRSERDVLLRREKSSFQEKTRYCQTENRSQREVLDFS